MSDFIVSARKYRPATFDSVVGQSSITLTLKNSTPKSTCSEKKGCRQNGVTILRGRRQRALAL